MNTKIEVELKLTPDQLAEAFICWGSDEQARFLNLIGEHFKKADFNAELQCCYMVNDIAKSGRDFVYTVANFLKVRGIPSGSPKEDTLINHYECHGI